MSDARSVNRWLEDYCAAFDALDGDVVAGHYAEPAMLLHREGMAYWPDRAAVAGNMRGLCAQYRAAGYRHARYALISEHRLGERHFFIEVRWVIHTAQGENAFSTAYQLEWLDARWQVRVCTAFDERPILAE
ncbi:hypothetical protein ACTSKR_07185 [Chitinibacteraceae bacterium HSL-7]